MSAHTGSCCALTAFALATLVGLTGCASKPSRLATTQPNPGPAVVRQPAAIVPSSSPLQRNVGITANDSPAIPATSSTQSVAPVVFREPVQPLPVVDFRLPSTQPELVLGQLVGDVLNQNRSLQAMVAAWRSASERYPQAIALDDPMFAWSTAPASWRSSDVTPANAFGGSQKIPWMGKRQLRGQVAQSEANAAGQDVADARLQLIQSTELAFFEYYLVHRQRELNAANTQRLQEFRDTAGRQYEANLVTQQDVLQAEVELADLARRQVELERMNRVAIARINTLLHRAPDCPLPPPPMSLPVDTAIAPVQHLRQTALQRRPDLAAIGARLQAERASLALAYKEFYPDFELAGRYDSFWQPDSQRDLRTQVGVNMNVPIYLEKRRAAAREAMFKLSQRQAEFEQRIDDINNEVQAAYERVWEMQQIIGLYATRTLPAANQNVDSARADYVAGKGEFLRLVAAQRQLIEAREKHQVAIAEYHARLADLERAVGGPIQAGGRTEELPAAAH